jgi:sulfur carrier protein
VIVLRVNGKEVQLDGTTSLLAYLEKLGVSPRAVAVEHNGVIIDRDAYATTTLGEGDVVEIVRMVGGGGVSGGQVRATSPDRFSPSSAGVPALLARGEPIAGVGRRGRQPTLGS